MFKVRFGWFGRVMASCLVAFNLLSGVGFCTHDNCTETIAKYKIHDLNEVLMDQESIYWVCRNVYRAFNRFSTGNDKFLSILKDIGNGNIQLREAGIKLHDRMYKEITTTVYPIKESKQPEEPEESKKSEEPAEPEKLKESKKSEELKEQQEKPQKKREYCLLVVTNVWNIRERFYFESKLCKDAIILINNFRRFNPIGFREEINQCKAVFDRNIKKIEAIKNASLVFDPSFFQIVDRRLERLKRYFDRVHTNIIIPTNQTEKLI